MLSLRNLPFWTPALKEKDRFFPGCKSNYFSCLSPSFPLLWMLLVKQWLRFCCVVLLRAPSVVVRGRHNNTRPYGQGISSGLYLLIKSCHCHQPLCSYTSPCSSVTHAQTRDWRSKIWPYTYLWGKDEVGWTAVLLYTNTKKHCTELDSDVLLDCEPFYFSGDTVMPQKCHERSNKSCLLLVILSLVRNRHYYDVSFNI